MGYNLFLDSEKIPLNVITVSEKDKNRYLNYKWKIVKSYEEFKNILNNNGIPDIISFEHDLNDEHKNLLEYDYDNFINKTGYHAAEYLIEYCNLLNKDLPIVLIHTQNPIGYKNIKNLFI
jgi:hypothetical protein